VDAVSDELRGKGALVASKTMEFSNHLRWFPGNGFGREDSRQIRYITEAFYSVEPVFTVLSAIALQWVGGKTPSITTAGEACAGSGTRPWFHGRIAFADSYYGPDVGYYGNDNHPLYRAFAMWPVYMTKIAADLAQTPFTNEYKRAIAEVDAKAEELAGQIPIPARERNYAIEHPRLIDCLNQCLIRSSEVVVLTCALRRMFIRAENIARRKHLSVHC